MAINWTQKPQVYEEPSKPKLPLHGRRNVLITAALPYVNNVPHLGTIIGCVLSGDVFARYCKLRGYQTLYVSGTDEYGTATEMKALKEGTTPEKICEKFYYLQKNIYDWFNIDFDHFGRTTTEHQTEICQDIFLKLHENGYTSTDSLEQLHCEKCDKFLADRFVHGTCPLCGFEDARGDQCDGCSRLLNAVELVDPKCHACGTNPIKKTSKHIFLDLDRLSSKVKEYIYKVIDAKDSHWSANAIAISKSWVEGGLQKRCITRDLRWGTPVPLEEFKNKVFYVWFDAPIGYLSITKDLLGKDWEKWWKNPEKVELYQFIGKDNVAFHAVMFPATELGTGDNFTMVKHLCATEYLNYEDKKFSKSRGTGVFCDQVAEIGIPADVWRFYLIYMRPETQDTAFLWDDFMLKVNSELNNNLGNFVNRALVFVEKFFDSVVPAMELTKVEHELFSEVSKDMADYLKNCEDVKLRDALQCILSVSRHGNGYIQANQPWLLIKGSDEERKRAGTIVGVSSNLAVLISVLLNPFMPEVSRQIRQHCLLDKLFMIPDHPVQFMSPGHKIGKPVPLFAKLEPKQIQEWKQKFGAAETNSVEKKVEKSKENAKVKQPKNQEKTNTKMATSKTKYPELAAKDAQIANLFNAVMDKFEQTKSKFESYHMSKLDRESIEMRAEIERLKRDLIKEEQKAGIPQIEVPMPQLKSQSSKIDELSNPKFIGKLVVEKPVENGKKDAKEKKSDKPSKKGQNGTIDNDSIDIGRIDLRVGRIIEVKKHPDADALYVESIDVGEEKPRTVVSGLVKWVPLEQMQNRLVVVMCNLKPAKMRGIESQAMVMCASTPEKVEIMEVDPLSVPGTPVYCQKYSHRPDSVLNPKKKIWETVAPDLKVGADGRAEYKGEKLLVGGKTYMMAPTLRSVNIK